METLNCQSIHENLFFNGIDNTYNKFFCMKINHVLSINMNDHTHLPPWIRA